MILQRFQDDLEAQFASYLERQLGLARGEGWDYEPEILGAAKRPDFVVGQLPRALLLDAKRFEPPTAEEWRRETAKTQAFDPYAGARSKIEEARRKFREFKGRFPCGVVLRSGALAEQSLEYPLHVFGAMLGSLGVQWPVDASGAADPDRGGSAFLGDGKMVNPKTRTPQNTTIGAIVVLRLVPTYKLALDTVLQGLRSVRVPRAERVEPAMRHASPATQERLARRESWQTIEHRVKLAATEIRRRGIVEGPPSLGVRVHLNPFSVPPRQIRFPHELFRGPVDEVWRYDCVNGRVESVFTGPELVRVDSLSKEVVQSLRGVEASTA